MNNSMNEMRFDTHDKLNRKDQAIKISRVLKNSENYSRPGEGLVIALNSSWGTGKTMFLKMWENEIKASHNTDEQDSPFPLSEDRTKILYYNAWNHDNYENAFIPLVAHFNRVFRKKLVSEHLKERSIKEIKKTIEMWFSTATKVSLTIAKNVTKKKLGLDKIDINLKELLDFNESDFSQYLALENEFENLNSDDIEKKLESLGDNEKNKYENIKKAIEPEIFEEFEEFRRVKEDFRKALEFIRGENQLIVFIDELDRCKPLYAIETLEVIKHFFSIPNVVFVLAIDLEQLSHSIATVYGQNMDAEGYLMRFMDMQFKLPTPKIDDYCLYLNSKNDKESFDDNQIEIMINIFRYLNLSIRDIEKMFVNIKIFCDSLEDDIVYDGEFFKFYCFMSVLKYKNLKKYRDIMNKRIDIGDFFENEEIYEIIKPLMYGNNKKFIKNFIKKDLLIRYIEESNTTVSNRKLEEIKENLECIKYINKFDLKKVDTYNLTFAQYVERTIEFVSGI